MSYRNDHDAALGRIAALESELARLQREREATPERSVARRAGQNEPQERKERGESGNVREDSVVKMIGVAVSAIVLIVALVARANDTVSCTTSGARWRTAECSLALAPP